MENIEEIDDILDINIKSDDTSKKTKISYSQIMTYSSCPHKWYLTYVKKGKPIESNIHLIFGSAMHVVIQQYLYVMYNSTIESADKLDLESMLLDEMKKQFGDAKLKQGSIPCTKNDFLEFYDDGLKILKWFKNNKSDYFSKKGCKLIGCEIPVTVPLNENIEFYGLIDIVLINTVSNKILIKDFKTSTWGWRNYEKNDEIKTQQMVLYKKMYSDMFNVPVDNIDIEYIILKRKLYENLEYPQKRVQKFSPPSGKVTVNKVMKNLDAFIKDCFSNEGKAIDKNYFKNANDKTCRFCPFNGDEMLCNKKNN